MITFNKNSNIEPVLCLCLVSLLVASAETHGRSVRAGITVAKVFKKELNQMFVSDWTQKITFCGHSEASIYRATLVIFLYEEVYLQTRLFGPVWLVYENFLWEEFSVKVGPTKPKKSHNLAGFAKQNENSTKWRYQTVDWSKVNSLTPDYISEDVLVDTKQSLKFDLKITGTSLMQPHCTCSCDLSFDACIKEVQVDIWT